MSSWLPGHVVVLRLQKRSMLSTAAWGTSKGLPIDSPSKVGRVPVSVPSPLKVEVDSRSCVRAPVTTTGRDSNAPTTRAQGASASSTPSKAVSKLKLDASSALTPSKSKIQAQGLPSSTPSQFDLMLASVKPAKERREEVVDRLHLRKSVEQGR